MALDRTDFRREGEKKVKKQSLPHRRAMAVAFNLATFKATVLKKIDNLFVDRSVQVKELQKLISGGYEEGELIDPPNSHEASLLLSFVSHLREIQQRRTAYKSTIELQQEAERMEAICSRTSLERLSPAVQDQINSVLLHFRAIGLYQMVFVMHAYIYQRCARCT